LLVLALALAAVPAVADDVDEEVADVAEEATNEAAEKGDAGGGPNGFSLAAATIPPDKILEGGPARDSIESVDAPRFVPAAEASWVGPQNPVVGLVVGGEARAYPVHLLEFHQVVNDRVGDVPVVLSYDPLTGAPLAYRRKLGDHTLSFGVSGLIYNCNFLLYDRETESLWSQMSGEAISGSHAGTRLERIPVRQETFARWLKRQPETRVLERPDPREIDYRYSPYTAYWVQDEIPFPVEARDKRFHTKELVLGVQVGEVQRAYVGSLVTRAGGSVEDRFQGKPIRLRYTSETGTFEYDVPDGVEVTEGFWFAWKAFHPDTEIWRGKPKQ
jgi:hypothetical protein